MALTPRVLIILTPPLDSTAGGVQMSTVKMSRMLSSQGYDVGVFSFASEKHKINDAITLFSAPSLGNVQNVENHTALSNAIRKFAPSVVINQMPYEHTITETIQRSTKAIRIGCLRNTLYSVRNNLDTYIKNVVPGPLQKPMRSRLGKAWLLNIHRRRHANDLRRIMANYHRFVMFAPPNLEELSYFVPDYDPASIALIPNSVPAVAKDIPVKDKRILWLARVSQHQKRADLILPLWRLLAPRLPDWTLDVVGDGPLLPELLAKAKTERLQRIEFHGRKPSQPYFERASIFVMTSEFEGFPNTLIEAQSCGAVPVVFDSYPMVRWLVADGENGILSPNRDIQTLAENIAGLCHSPDRCAAMSHAALKSAMRFTEDEVSVQWKLLVGSFSK